MQLHPLSKPNLAGFPDIVPAFSKWPYVNPASAADRSCDTTGTSRSDQPCQVRAIMKLYASSHGIVTVGVAVGLPASADRPSLVAPAALLSTLQALRAEVGDDGRQLFARWRPLIARRAFLASARNLADYLSLRRHDLRSLQAELTPWGLSSLGRCEAQVTPTLDAVIATLAAAVSDGPARHRPVAGRFQRGARRLAWNTDELFDRRDSSRRIRIMVTLPTEAGNDPRLVRGLLAAGMDCARINCAHDDSDVWDAMIRAVRQEVLATGRGCRVLMDLAGPKIRLEEVCGRESEPRVFVGGRLMLTRSAPTGVGPVPLAARLSLPAILDVLAPGAEAWIDDGRIGTRVESVGPAGACLVVTHARPKGERLRAEKGVNFPGTPLHLGALTDDDREALDFVAVHADLVGFSFVQEPEDIIDLQAELARRRQGRPLPGLVAKIETQRAVANLPGLIVQAAGRQSLAVMIARGDLAVEIGYRRLAEMQEEMLWLCEAAHVPIIWATQVLESLVKRGLPSRAEVTDAAMAERAECVMLNKGPYVREAVGMLDDVLRRMQAHTHKKTAQLRPLQAWEHVFGGPGDRDATVP